MKAIFSLFFSISIIYLHGQQSGLGISFVSGNDLTFLVENCNNNEDSIHVELNGQLNGPIPFTVGFAGDADTSDFDLFFGGMVLNAGSQLELADELTLTITASNDNLPEGTEELILILTNTQNNQSDSLTISIYDVDELVITPDTSEIVVCQKQTINLSNNFNKSVIWRINDDTIKIGNTLNYTVEEEVTITAQLGSCQITDDLNIGLTAGFQFSDGDTTFICLGTPGTIQTESLGTETGDFTWSVLDSTDMASGGTLTVNPLATRTYFLTLQTASCLIRDSIVARVDSLPDSLAIAVIEDKETYCPGDRVVLFSPSLLPESNYPDVLYSWMFEAGSYYNSDSSRQNIEVILEDTSFFTRTTTNNACEIKDSILLLVINPPKNLNITDTTVCPNQPVRLELLNADIFDKVEWEPEECVSCTKCDETIARSEQSKTINVNVEQMGCPSSASVNLNIFGPVSIPLDVPDIVCPGEPFDVVILSNEEVDVNAWEGNNASFTCPDCEMPVVTISQSSTISFNGIKEDGCLVVGSASISTYTVPNIVIAGCSQSSFIGTTITFAAELSPMVGISTYTWTHNGMGQSSNTTNVDIVLVEDNEIMVDLITDEGCQVSAVTDCQGQIPPLPKFPNAFSPNNQGEEQNEIFIPLLNGNRYVELKIFNRWGKLVYEDTNGNGWDGNINGNKAPSEVYAYSFTFERFTGETITVTGDLTLIR